MIPAGSDGQRGRRRGGVIPSTRLGTRAPGTGSGRARTYRACPPRSTATSTCTPSRRPSAGMFERYGVPLRTMQEVVVNGRLYSSRPASRRQGRCEATAHSRCCGWPPGCTPTFRRRNKTAARALEQRIWRARTQEWRETLRPGLRSGEPRPAGRGHRRLRRRDPPRPRAPCPHARGRRAPAPLRPPRRRPGSARALPHRLPRLGDRSGRGHRRADRSLAEHHVRRRRAPRRWRVGHGGAAGPPVPAPTSLDELRALGAGRGGSARRATSRSTAGASSPATTSTPAPSARCPRSLVANVVSLRDGGRDAMRRLSR